MLEQLILKNIYIILIISIVAALITGYALKKIFTMICENPYLLRVFPKNRSQEQREIEQ